MAKELMEIGGFITEGAEIVNHDASLSGNGTVDSPLGVVPGYNETVLYSGALTSAANLSEPMTAFEKIDVYMASDNTDVNNFHFVNTIDPNNGAKNWPCTNGLGSYAWLAINLLQTTTAYNTLTCPKYKYINFGAYNSTAASFSVTTGTNANIIRKIIGINRKVQ